MRQRQVSVGVWDNNKTRQNVNSSTHFVSTGGALRRPAVVKLTPASVTYTLTCM